MTKKNLGSGIMGNFLEYKFLYCLAVLFNKNYVLLLHSNNKGESIKKKKVMYVRVIWFPQFIFPNFRLKINLERKLQLRRKDNKQSN